MLWLALSQLGLVVELDLEDRACSVAARQSCGSCGPSACGWLEECCWVRSPWYFCLLHCEGVSVDGDTCLESYNGA